MKDTLSFEIDRLRGFNVLLTSYGSLLENEKASGDIEAVNVLLGISLSIETELRQVLKHLEAENLKAVQSYLDRLDKPI